MATKVLKPYVQLKAFSIKFLGHGVLSQQQDSNWDMHAGSTESAPPGELLLCLLHVRHSMCVRHTQNDKM